MADFNFTRPNKDTKLGESNVKFFIGKVVGYSSMEDQIEKDNKLILDLNDTDSLEKFARETYGHKKENETILIVE